MASYPSAKVHRPSRRKLGRGQHTQLPQANLVVTDTADTATLTFDRPVIVNGVIPLNVTGGVTLTTQTIVSQTVVHQLYSGPLTTLQYSFPANDPSVANMQGGGCAGAAGTFS